MYPDGSPSRTVAAMVVVSATANGGTARVGEAVEAPEANAEAVLGGSMMFRQWRSERRSSSAARPCRTGDSERDQGRAEE